MDFAAATIASKKAWVSDSETEPYAQIAQQLRVAEVVGHSLLSERVLEAREEPIRKLAEQADVLVAPAVRTHVAHREDELPLAVADERHAHEGAHLSVACALA
jgi:hypothetical protein